MSLKWCKYKTGEHENFYQSKLEPQARNPTYLKPVSVGCPYCGGRGRKKNYKNIWCLYMHFKIHHPHENYKELAMNLANLVIQGVLL